MTLDTILEQAIKKYNNLIQAQQKLAFVFGIDELTFEAIDISKDLQSVKQHIEQLVDVPLGFDNVHTNDFDAYLSDISEISDTLEFEVRKQESYLKNLVNRQTAKHHTSTLVDLYADLLDAYDDYDYYNTTNNMGKMLVSKLRVNNLIGICANRDDLLDIYGIILNNRNYSGPLWVTSDGILEYIEALGVKASNDTSDITYDDIVHAMFFAVYCDHFGYSVHPLTLFPDEELRLDEYLEQISVHLKGEYVGDVLTYGSFYFQPTVSEDRILSLAAKCPKLVENIRESKNMKGLEF